MNTTLRRTVIGGFLMVLAVGPARTDSQGSPTAATSAGVQTPAAGPAREEALTRLMKDFRLAYRSLKSSLKEGDGATSREAVARMKGWMPQLKSLRPEHDAEAFDENAQALEKNVEALAAALQADDHGGALKRFDEVRRSCQSCHAHFQGPVARFMENLFLF